MESCDSDMIVCMGQSMLMFFLAGEVLDSLLSVIQHICKIRNLVLNLGNLITRSL
jgi:hypothetical protein